MDDSKNQFEPGNRRPARKKYVSQKFKSFLTTLNDVDEPDSDQEHQIQMKGGQHHQKPSVTSSSICPICSKTFRSRDCLKRHQRRHEGLKPFSCDQCQKGFSSSQALQEHQYLHSNERPFSCHLCNRKFRQLSSLVRHKVVHQTTSHQRSSSGHLCPECGKSFSMAQYLKSHLRVHGEKRSPYLCQECCKVFQHPSSLIRHRKSHAGNRIQCSQCPSKFSDPSNVKRHCHVHNDLPLALPSVSSVPEEEYLSRPHLDKQSYFDWLRPFVAQTTLVLPPFRKEFLLKLTHLHKCLVDCFSGQVVLPTRENLECLSESVNILQKSIGKHTGHILNHMET